jgi:1-acyl-sn-glycerol-3-phosphate acyltransferase
MMKVLLWLRAFLLIPFVIIHTFCSSILVISLLLLHFPKSWVNFIIGSFWCGTIVFLSGIKINIKGIENVPIKTGFLYLFTHSSHLDIPVMFAKSPKSFRFGAKSELFKIPFFGQAIKLSGTLPITRENRSKVMAVYQQAEKRVAQGEAFALSPEGGRRRGDELLDFKSGPFIFAINAKMPIVPVILCKTNHCLKKGSFFINPDRLTREVGMHFLEPVDISLRSIDEVKLIKNELRDKMLKEFNEMKKIYL